MTGPDLRRAVPSDAPSLAEIVERAYGHYPARIGLRPAPMDADYAQVVEQDEVWVAAVDGVPAGLAVLQPGDDHLMLENVAVDPAYQGRGVGRTLLDLVEDRATALGFRTVRLYTHALMTENRRLYEARGYVLTHQAQQDRFNRVFYRKDLGAPAP